MKSIGLIFIWAFLFYSCKEVTYKVPQPANASSLKEIPASLHGEYQPVGIYDDEKKDTVIIESWGYHFKDSSDKDFLGKGVISDSLVIKFYRDFYFFIIL